MPTVTDPEQLLHRARVFAQRGDLAEAERLCREWLAMLPMDFAANDLLGAIRIRQGRNAEALAPLEYALKIQPGQAGTLCNYASALRALGRFAEALAACNAALSAEPEFAAALYNRGNILQDLNQHAEALADYDRAIARDPDFAQAHNNRGNALLALGSPDEAILSYGRAVALGPDDAEAWSNRANALLQLKRLDEALESHDQAIRANPASASAHYNRAKALRELGRLDEAEAGHGQALRFDPAFAAAHADRGALRHDLRRFAEALEDYDRAIALKPDDAQAHSNRGSLLKDMGRHDEALQSLDRALALNPGDARALVNKGAALAGLRRFDPALQNLDQAIRADPALAEAYWNKSLCLLAQGHFDEGWQLYEWRKKLAKPLGSRSFPCPAWRGEDIKGKTLLVHAEQGLGDMIQFCRYVPLAERRGAHVVFCVPERLVRLLKGLRLAGNIIGETSSLPDCDFHIPLLSMPRAFQTHLENIPADVPYLAAEPHRVRQWKRRIGQDGLRIGICWQGNRRAGVDIGRSFSPRHLADIAKIPGVGLFSLQKGDGAGELDDLPPGMDVRRLGADFDSGGAFVDTAAVMENLDLVITSDTAIAHLAGALGRPAWVALQHAPDWRWLLNRGDSPWYPGMRLFRQSSPGDWPPVFNAMAEELRAMALQA